MHNACAYVGVNLASKKYRRTTIELDESLYRRIKKLAVEKDKTLRDIITEALEEKLRKEEELMEAFNSDFMRNKIAKKIVKAMENFISEEAAKILFKTKCENIGINPTDISADDITHEFIHSICNSMRHISNIDMEECVEHLESGVD